MLNEATLKVTNRTSTLASGSEWYAIKQKPSTIWPFNASYVGRDGGAVEMQANQEHDDGSGPVPAPSSLVTHLIHCIDEN